MARDRRRPPAEAREYVLGLGSNRGSRLGYLRAAMAVLRASPYVRMSACSSVYLTKPVGPPQPWFANAAVRVESPLAPEAMLEETQGVERLLGRKRAERWGPRCIDVDLLWANVGSVQTATLALPHPQLESRSFALHPLLELVPELEATYGARRARLGPPGEWVGYLDDRVQRSTQSGVVSATGLDLCDAISALVEGLGGLAQRAESGLSVVDRLDLDAHSGLAVVERVLAYWAERISEGILVEHFVIERGDGPESWRCCALGSRSSRPEQLDVGVSRLRVTRVGVAIEVSVGGRIEVPQKAKYATAPAPS